MISNILYANQKEIIIGERRLEHQMSFNYKTFPYHSEILNFVHLNPQALSYLKSGSEH